MVLDTAIIFRSVAKALAASRTLFARLMRADALKQYRPERHYMRGPGPQWHAKHDAPAAARHVLRRPPSR